MKEEKSALLVLLHGGMEICWVYALANFTMISIFHRVFPLPEALITFWLGAALTHFSKGKGWRVIQGLGLQVLGLALVALQVTYVFGNPSQPFFGQAWILEFFGRPRDVLEWMILFLMLFWTLMFWLGGVALSRRSLNYTSICIRFDLGVTAFFILHVVKALAMVKGGILFDDSLSGLLLLPFFLFSFLGIGLARNHGGVRGKFLAGYQGVGLALSFAVVVLVAGTGMVLLLFHHFIAVAEMGYGMLKQAAKPMVPVLISVLRFLLMHDRIRQGPGGSSGKDRETDPEELFQGTGEPGPFGEILFWGLALLLGSVALFFIGLGIMYGFRWLLSRTSYTDRQGKGWHSVLGWLFELGMRLLLWITRIFGKGSRMDSAARIFAYLLTWGRHSGLPRFPNETPIEYGMRLEAKFPDLKQEIELIIGYFNLAVYGETSFDKQKLGPARSAWRRMRSPRLWASRIKLWLFHPGEGEEMS